MKIFTTYGPEEKRRIFVRDRGYAFTIRQTGRDKAMTNDDRNSTLRKNRYIFASAGAVLGVAAGASRRGHGELGGRACRGGAGWRARLSLADSDRRRNQKRLIPYQPP